MNTMLSYLKKAFSFTKKAILVIAVYIFVIVFFSHFSAPDKPRVVPHAKPSSNTSYDLIHDPKLNATNEGRIGIALYRVTLCGLIGESCTNNPADDEKNFSHSLFGGISNLIAMPYANPPASGVHWVRSSLEGAGFIPKTYAATGIGFSGLQPFQGLWKIFRNFSYLLLVLIIIAIGFMIMFRTKVNAQTVISVENALPRIIIALILITLSFPIAGFLVDLMYVTIVISVSIISQVNVGSVNLTNMPKLQNQYIGASVKDLWLGNGTAFDVGYAIVAILPDALRSIIKGFVGTLATFYLVNKILSFGDVSLFEFVKNLSGHGGLATVEAGVGVGGALSALIKSPIFIFFFILILPLAGGLVIALIFSITLLFFLFRVFFILLTAYIKVLLFIIFSPLILLFVAIPGRQGFSWWIKNLIAELATFPIVIALILVGRVITDVGGDDKLLRPPFLYNIDPKPFTTLIGVGLILMIPNLIKSAKTALGAKGIGGLGAGTFFAGVGALGGGATGLMQKYYYAQHIGPLKSLMEKFGPKAKGAAETARRTFIPGRGGNPRATPDS